MKNPQTAAFMEQIQNFFKNSTKITFAIQKNKDYKLTAPLIDNFFW